MLVVVLLVAAAVRLGAQAIEARTPYFRVITTGDAADAASAATFLERTRAQFLALGFRLPDALIEVVLFQDRAEMRPYAAGNSIAYFQQGTERIFLVVAQKEAGDPLRALAHELAHCAQQQSGRSLPVWLREGLADLLSNLAPVETGVKLGLPIPGHVHALQATPWIDWREVVAAVRDASRPDVFYAQAWLLAHRLLVGRPIPGTLAQRVEALPTAGNFQPNLAGSLPTEVIPLEAHAGEDFELRVTEAWEHEYRLAELLRALNRVTEARRALLALRERYPARSEPADSLGALAMDNLDYDEAERWLAEAARLGSVQAATHYRYALLLMRPGHRPEDAARHARRAVEIDPSQAMYWLAVSHAEMQLFRWDTARAALAQVEARAADPVLRDQVKVERAELDRRREEDLRPPKIVEPPALAVLATPIPTPAPPPPPVRVPAEKGHVWGAGQQLHPGTVTFWGYIRRVDCGPDGKIVTVQNPRFTVRVWERPGGKPLRLPCNLKNVEVNVVYRPTGRGSVNGDLVAVIY